MTLLLSLLACSSTTELLAMDLYGWIDVPDGARTDGAVFAEVHHAQAGSGELAHPLGLVYSFEQPALGPFDESVDYPVADGTGVVLYAWLDHDGDGVLCAPDALEPEPAGIAVVADWPVFDAELFVSLTEPCAGPEALYPPPDGA